jgi:hypothetical protein
LPNLNRLLRFLKEFKILLIRTVKWDTKYIKRLNSANCATLPVRERSVWLGFETKQYTLDEDFRYVVAIKLYKTSREVL